MARVIPSLVTSAATGAAGLTGGSLSAGLRSMSEPAPEFRERVVAVLERFFAQNARPVPSVEEGNGFAARLWSLVAERGLPPPLPPGEAGAPGEMSDAECAPLVQRILGGSTDPLLADAARQLVKA